MKSTSSTCIAFAYSVMILSPLLASAAGRHALLVGVSQYPSLGEHNQLKGPANDVHLMREMLTKFEFPPEHICTLSDEAGAENPTYLPTRANIERAFARLADVARPGDQIVVFMAGHGSQQPEQEQAAGEYHEPDGLDEIFLPRDVGQWEGDTSHGTVPNAIVDNEIGEWLSTIRAKDAHLWVIFDCCHSGDITRGFGEQERFVPPDDREGLNIPGAALDKARRAASGQRDEPGMALPHKRSSISPIEMDLDKTVVICACQPQEKAIERNLPEYSDGKCYGLLTFSLNAVLSQASRALSYQELGKRIHEEYVRLGRMSGPTPLAEGNDIKRAVLGTEVITRPPIMMSTDMTSRTLQVDAGRLHGLTAGSVLAVFSPPGEGNSADNEKPIGHVRVARVGVATATVVPCECADIAEPRRESLIGGRCEVVEVDYGDLLLCVAIDEDDADGKRVSEPVKQRLQQHLVTMVAKEQTLVKQARSGEDADWFIRFHDGHVSPLTGDVYLVPASEWSGTHIAARDEVMQVAVASRVLGPFRFDDTLPEMLYTALHRVARAENLLKLTSNQHGEAYRNDFGVQMKVEVRRLKEEFDQEGEPISSPLEMRPGDLIRYIVSNPGSVPFDLTVLYVDSRYGITAHFPAGGVVNRWQPGDEKRLPVVVFNDETFGREHIVFLAVSSKGQPVDFARLEQESIQQYRGEGVGVSMESGLSRLLEKALYGEGTTRSSTAQQITTYQFDVIPVDVRPSR